MVDINKNSPPPLQSQNPYQAPTSAMQMAVSYDNELIDPQRLSIGAGWSWISDAWQIFKAAIGTWLLSVLIMLVVGIIVAIIPVLQLLSGALNVFFMAGVAYMAHKIVNDEPISVGDLLIGLQKNTLQLFLVFVFGAVAMIVIIGLLIILGLVFGLGFSSFLSQNTSLMIMLLMVLIALALLIPVYMAMWFAPVLVILHDRPATEAMKLSFFACLRNLLPFLWYGIVLGLFMLLALLPLGLGVFITLPLMMISCYTAYRQIMTRI